MYNKTEKYYSQERDNLYKNAISKLSRKVVYTNLTFKKFVEKYFNHHTQDEFGKQIPLAQFHIDLADKIINSTTYEAVLQLARNHAKTTVFGLFLPIYLMLRGETHFVLYIGNSKDLAVKQIINIQSELESNRNLILDFGEFTKIGNWSKGNFIVDRYDTAFYCVGKGQSTRGLKYGHYRPDFIIADDIDTDKEVMNQSIVSKQTNWILQSVFPAMSLKKYRFIMLGNKFAPDMVLTRIMDEVDNIEILKVNAIANNGEPSWKERFAIEDLRNIERKIGKIRFQREFMNEPIIEGSVFKPEWIEWYHNTSIKYEYKLIYVDPSFKKNGDYKAVLTLGIKNSTYYVIDLFERKTTMEVIFKYLYDRFDPAIRIYIEANFAQDLHKDTYLKIEKQQGYKLPIVWDKSKKPNKIARIENMSVFFEQGNILFNNKLKDSPDFKQFYLEYLSFPTGKNDDGIDSLESAITTINKNIRKHQPYIIGGRQTQLLI